MALRPIPDPVLSSRKPKVAPESKPSVNISIPKPPSTPPKEASEPKKETTTTTVQPPPLRRKPQQKRAPEAGELELSQTFLDASAPLGVTDDGKPVPRPFKPVDPLIAMGDPMARAMMRQLSDMSEPMPDTSKGACALIERLETSINNGEDLAPLNNAISARIMGSSEHGELFSRLTDSLDYERVVEIFKSRSKFEDFCHAAMRCGDLTVTEGMAVMSYFHTQLVHIFTRIDKKNKGDTPAMRESIDLVEKVNRPTLIANKELQQKFNKASPQEREILRKIGFSMANALAARVTKTTTTETVEIIKDGTDQTA